jgi:hypothetical protein
VPYVLGMSRETTPDDFSPVGQDGLEFDSNTAHSSGQYWKNGGCIYMGGVLLSPDPANHSHYAYTFAKFPMSTPPFSYPDIYRGKFIATNTKMWACAAAFLSWGVSLGIRPLVTVDRAEFHDNRMGIQFFAHNVLKNAVFTAQTGNVHAFNAYVPSTAFKTYDMFMQTLFENVTVRGYKGPGDVAFLYLVVTDNQAQEGFTGYAGITALDTDADHLIQLQRGDYCQDVEAGSQEQTGSATQFINLQDLDGSFSGFTDGGILGAADCPQYNKKKYRTQNWWWLDDDCKVNYTFVPLGTSGDTIGSGLYVCPMKSPHAWATQPRTLAEVRVRPYMPGVMYHWGHEDRYAELIYKENEGFDYGTLGPCCDIGWYLQLDEGVPAEMKLKISQMVFEGGLFFATRYPSGASLTIQRCRDNSEDKPLPTHCTDVTQALEKSEFLTDTTGLKFFVDSDGVLFMRLIDPDNQWFEQGKVHILENLQPLNPYYVINSDMTGHTEMMLPPEGWMALA